MITFKILTPETMKLLASTKSKIAKDKNYENVPHLEIVELVLVHCNLLNNDSINKIEEYYIHFFQTNHLVVC